MVILVCFCPVEFLVNLDMYSYREARVPPDGWKCPTCGFNNKQANKVCGGKGDMGCKTPRAGASVPFMSGGMRNPMPGGMRNPMVNIMNPASQGMGMSGIIPGG